MQNKKHCLSLWRRMFRELSDSKNRHIKKKKLFWNAAIFRNTPSQTFMVAIILPVLGTNLSEWLKIQKRETPSCGPSFTNSCPSPLPHLPQRTCNCSIHSYHHPVWPVLFKVHHGADPLAPDVPCRQSESPSSWWRCLLWWFLWKLAKEMSGQTWSGWRTAGGCIGSTRIYLEEAVGFRTNRGILKNTHFKLCNKSSPTMHCPILLW